MMSTYNTFIKEGRLAFYFSKGIQVTKYDDWSFYRNQFNRAFGGTKATDLIALDGSTTWLIEIKDYRQHKRTKLIDLGDEIAIKIRDTLAGLVAAQCSANDPEEKKFARSALKAKSFRVVLHLEQPQKHSKLFPKAIDPVTVIQKLRQKLKPIDAHAIVVDQYNIADDMSWIVEGI